MDVLSNVLQVLRLRASVFFHNRFCSAWSVDTSGSGKGTFHLIARGNCWLHRKGQTPVPLRGGDLIVFPRDAEHVVSDSSEPPVPQKPDDACDTEGPSTTLICGYFGFDTGAQNPVLDALPEFLHIRGDDVGNRGWNP
jgi:AraC family transcriptional activator of mtrCDE